MGLAKAATISRLLYVGSVVVAVGRDDDETAVARTRTPGQVR